jgi:hypothetical protein
VPRDKGEKIMMNPVRKMRLSGLALILLMLVTAVVPSATSAARTWATVRRGDNGDNVYAVQAMLQHRGSALAVDADFGPGTEAAVKSFQSANGLVSDGVVGLNTWEKLVVTVRRGDNNGVVKALQRELNKHGATHTHNATVSFQQSKGLEADGIAGANTWAALTLSPAGGGGTRAQLAATIRDSARISLWTRHDSGMIDSAYARTNIVDTANGGQARRSSYGNAPGGSVWLDTRLLSGMIALSQSWSYSVSEIAGGSHSTTSRHYAGVAVDVASINGQTVSASHPNQSAFRARCRELGATEVLGPGDSGHSTHIHCAWPRP